MKIVPPAVGGEGLIGGAPPASARSTCAGLRFFVSVPFAVSPPESLSVFVAEMERLESGKLHLLGAVDVSRHEPSIRGEASDVDSELSPMSICLGEETTDDEVEGGDLVPWSGHKLGGRPFLFPRVGRLTTEIEQLMADGYLHVLQMAFPDRDELIRGSWPFGDGELHIFGKPPFSRDLWRWCWQH